MKEQFNLVGEFNEAFGVPEQKEVSARTLDEDKFLYKKLLEEEIGEYFDAVVKKDKVEVCDALVDEMYILIGKIRKHGLSAETFEKLFIEVHKSNMSKLAEDGTPLYRADGKVMKGPKYFKPQLGKIIDNS